MKKQTIAVICIIAAVLLGAGTYAAWNIFFAGGSETYVEDTVFVNEDLFEAATLLQEIADQGGFDEGNVPDKERILEAYDILINIDITEDLTDEERGAHSELLEAAAGGTAAAIYDQMLEALDAEDFNRMREEGAEYIGWVIENSRVLTGSGGKVPEFMDRVQVDSAGRNLTVEEFQERYYERADQYAGNAEEAELFYNIVDAFIMMSIEPRSESSTE